MAKKDKPDAGATASGGKVLTKNNPEVGEPDHPQNNAAPSAAQARLSTLRAAATSESSTGRQWVLFVKAAAEEIRRARRNRRRGGAA
jgi:hypothetical protein